MCVSVCVCECVYVSVCECVHLYSPKMYVHSIDYYIVQVCTGITISTSQILSLLDYYLTLCNNMMQPSVPT